VEAEHSTACFQWHIGCAVARVVALEYQLGWALGSLRGVVQYAEAVLDREFEADPWIYAADLVRDLDVIVVRARAGFEPPKEGEVWMT
jgi:hypothetical protein